MTALKVIGSVFLALVVLLGAAVAALFLLDWNIIKDEVEALASDTLDRSVQIGHLDVEPGWVTRIHLAELRIGNPDWARAESLATIPETSISVEVWPLLGGNLVLEELRVLRPKLNLERDAEGRENWALGAVAETAGEVVAPEERDEFPAIARLRIVEGTLSYRDAIRDVAAQGTVATVEGKVQRDDRIELTLEGRLQGEPLAFDFSGGSLLTLRDSAVPYPLDLIVTLGQTELRAQGTVAEPMKLRDFDMDLALTGPSLAEIFPLLAVPLPDTPPYQLTGALDREGDVWRVSDFSGTVGDSDLSGALSLDQSGEKPFLKADLVSKRLDFDDLAGLIGAPPDPQETASAEQQKEAEAERNDGSIFPDTPLADDRLHAMNMDVTFEGAEVTAERFPIEKLSMRVQLTDGRALVRPLSLLVAKGQISGEVALNARRETPSADADLSFDGLDLKPFFKNTDFVQEMGGRFSGHLYLLGSGKSLDAMMATAQGRGWLGIRDGAISGLLVEAAGLDIAEALALVIAEDVQIPLYCGRVDLDVSDGLLQAKRAVIDTADSILLAKGSADLAAETLDLQIESRAKDFSLIDAAAPVSVSGSFEDPSVSIGGFDPLPFLELGDAEDLNCDRLLSGEIDQLQLEKDGTETGTTPE